MPNKVSTMTSYDRTTRIVSISFKIKNWGANTMLVLGILAAGAAYLELSPTQGNRCLVDIGICSILWAWLAISLRRWDPKPVTSFDHVGWLDQTK
jgi:hypothetical protein